MKFWTTQVAKRERGGKKGEWETKLRKIKWKSPTLDGVIIQNKIVEFNANPQNLYLGKNFAEIISVKFALYFWYIVKQQIRFVVLKEEITNSLFPALCKIGN